MQLSMGVRSAATLLQWQHCCAHSLQFEIHQFIAAIIANISKLSLDLSAVKKNYRF